MALLLFIIPPSPEENLVDAGEPLGTWSVSRILEAKSSLPGWGGYTPDSSVLGPLVSFTMKNIQSALQNLPRKEQSHADGFG